MQEKVVIDKEQEEDEIRDFEQCGCEIGCGGCGTRRFPMKFLNCFNNAKFALVFFCIGVFCQGLIVNGFISIVISTLERRFHLMSSETGFIAGSYDIGVCLALPLVTYIGGRGHRPLWIGWGVFIMGLGSIVFSLPHFIAPYYSVSDFSVCTNSSGSCGESSLRVYRGFFILSQLLHGIGASPLFTLSLTYLDANVKQSKSSVYTGIFFAFSIIGPGVGFLLGGRFLTLFTNLGEDVSIDQESPLWIGNWWLGFLVAGAFTVLISIPIIMYPRQIPGTEKYRLDREKEVHQNKGAVAAKENEKFGTSIKEFPHCLLILLKIPTLIFLSLSGSMDSGMAIALVTFGPKYIEAMFSLTASSASLYFGLATILSASTAQIVGGIIVSKFKLSVKGMIKFCIICSSLAFGLLFSFMIRCDNLRIAGVNVPYYGESTIHCQSESGCSTNLYNPVCGSDDLTYLSYCDAGCTEVESRKGVKTYVNCTRVLESPSITLLQNSTASSGKCSHQTSCPHLGIFLFVAGVAVFCTFLKAQPALQASMRCVPFVQRSFAIGIQWLFIRIFGTIPLPIICGQVLDLSCLVWGKECDSRGSCKLYSNVNMSNYITTLLVSAKGVSLIFLLLAWRTYKSPIDSEMGEVDVDKSTPDHREEENGNQTKIPEAFAKGISRDSHYDNTAFTP